MNALPMSRLQELIERYCPDGVEYKEIGEIGAFTRGSSFQKKHFVKDGVPCIHYGQVHTQFNLSTDHAVSYLDPVFAAKMKRAKSGDLIIATTSEDDQAVGKAIAWMGDADVVVSNDAYIYRHRLDPMYMAYVFASDLYQQPKLKYVTGTKVRRVHEKKISKIRIPVPPIEVQREIVRLLDAYTAAHDALIDRLNEEIELQAKSLAAYRESLLTFAERERVRWATLGEIAAINTGTKPKSEMGEGLAYEYINAGTTASGFVDDWNTEGDTVTTPSRGQGGIGYVGYSKEPFWCGPLCYRIRSIDEGVSNKYIYHALNANRDLILGCVKEGGTPAVNQKDLRKIVIPVPAVDEQERIVTLLDMLSPKSDTLCDSISEEIEWRKVQLAEFRNQLLTFPEKVA